MTCSVIIVTYNSQKYLPEAIQCLKQQTLPPHEVIIADTGSKDNDYLDRYVKHPKFKVVFAEKEAGFCKGNNLGLNHVDAQSDFVFLLNPDAFLTPEFLEKAVGFMLQPENSRCGALTGTVLGYDISFGAPTGKYDTTGVFKTWYGRWYDRDQGKQHQAGHYRGDEEVPALCGAVFFCRKKALDEVLINGKEIFDPAFYMYKEDIDLSLRLKRKNWKLMYVPDLIAYHCRGWDSDRKKMSRKARLSSARNELTINFRSISPFGIIYSCAKYYAVRFLDI